MTTCESCSMPIESGHYCQYCADESGQLKDFDTIFARMTSWQRRSTPDATEAEIEGATLDFLATMPAWKEHPRVLAR